MVEEKSHKKEEKEEEREVYKVVVFTARNALPFFQ